MSPRSICTTCLRPSSACYCRYIEPVRTRWRIVILQHPREARMPVNTGRMAHLALPHSQLHVGARWLTSDTLPGWLRAPGSKVALLYPAPNARGLSELTWQPGSTLVLLDGTWAQAKSMLRNSPPLQRMPMYAFEPTRPSEYRIRREPRASYLSTIEALAHVLSRLEDDPKLEARLLAPFRAMVEFQLRCVAERHEPRARRRRKGRGRHPVLDQLPPGVLEHPERVVCFSAEANAWPKSDPDARQRSLVHLVARRPHDGVSFEAVVRPVGPIAPATPSHAGLTERAMLGGELPSVASARWRQFLPHDAILCSWGYYPLDLLREQSMETGAGHVDLRGIVKHLTKRRWGTVEQASEELTSAQAERESAQPRASAHCDAVVRLWRYVLQTISGPGLE